MTDLGSSVAYGINDSGQVVGWASRSSSGGYVPPPTPLGQFLNGFSPLDRGEFENSLGLPVQTLANFSNVR
jgi:uncharacterized membrane protein